MKVKVMLSIEGHDIEVSLKGLEELYTELDEFFTEEVEIEQVSDEASKDSEIDLEEATTPDKKDEDWP